MIERLRQLTERERDVRTGRQVAAEYLQARLLESLQLGGTFLRWAFLGGTALRFLYGLCHHDRASLLAGKLGAILTRPWTKGRDLYDLAWYLADRRWPEPNLTMLNAALVQTGWPGPAMTSSNWRRAIRQRLANLDWPAVQADVLPFLERQHDLQLVTREALSQLLRDPDLAPRTE